MVERCSANNWTAPLQGYGSPGRPPVVALGKFDAMHKGHLALAVAAAQTLSGSPVLLSFSNMATVLGWQQRPPMVAPCDRARVLASWAPDCSASASTRRGGRSGQGGRGGGGSGGGSRAEACVGELVLPRQRYLPFSELRSKGPEEFVQLLARDLGAAGVVAGVNYRFGYKAAGDAAALQELGRRYGLAVEVVDLIGAKAPGVVGVVSSSKIRDLLAAGRVDSVARCLGRRFRLVAALQPGGVAASSSGSSSSDGAAGSTPAGPGASAAPAAICSVEEPVGCLEYAGRGAKQLLVPAGCLLNEAPGPGVYACTVRLYAGAGPEDDLLGLEGGVEAVLATTGDAGGGLGLDDDDGVAGDATPEAVEVRPQGLLVQAGSQLGQQLLELGGGRALLVVDFTSLLWPVAV